MQRKPQNLRQSLRCLWRNDQGASIVEFAIVAPVLLLFLIGSLEYGMIFFVDMTMESSAGIAGRFYADLNTGNLSDTALIRQEFAKGTLGFIDENQLQITSAPLSAAAEAPTVYTLKYRWNFMTPFLGRMITGMDYIDLESKVTVLKYATS